MDIARIGNSPAGRLVSIRGTDARTGDFDHYAFVPEPLPDHIDLTQETWNAVARTMLSLGRLSQACDLLPNPAILIEPALTKEALSTSALEGTYGALPDVLEARLPMAVPKSPEIREIVAYERMAEEAFKWVADRPITVGMLCNLQRILADGSRQPQRDPGKVREHQVVIGPEHSTVHDARFVPPPPGDLLRAGLDDWQRWINEDHEMPVVVAAALAHYQFECLHPFGDGNGRVGRLVIILQMLRAGTLTAPSLTISPWLLKRRDEYQDHLLGVSCTGDWNPWVSFFCAAVREQCDTHVAVAQRLLDWMTALRRKLHERRWGGVITNVAESLIDWPVVTGRLVVEQFNVSGPTAQHAIDRLVELGALREMTGRSYSRIFGAHEVMRIVDSL